MNSQNPDKCPNCNSDNIDIYDVDQGTQYMIEKAYCMDCGTQWLAHFEIVFKKFEDIQNENKGA